ncbi:hypothetical protein [Marinobacter sp.]|uniref:hypothetical protein n=1 Tax=Marinobacter sp. TaxID=50741 RepID=UPI001A0A47EE|nr:hypothetical protein [Marinobacter sp.]MBE0485606.1 hypothetical protein [Marinobacter sp.]
MRIRSARPQWLLLVLLLSPVAHGLQDPTQPPGSAVEPVSAAPARDLRVGSILLGAERRVAVINGVALTEGDRHDGLRVRRIHKDRVEVTDRGQPRVLYPEPLPQVRKTP